MRGLRFRALKLMGVGEKGGEWKMAWGRLITVLSLVRVELWRNVTIVRHYPMALITSLIQAMLFSVAVIWGLTRLGYWPSAVGTVLWPLLMTGLGSPSSSLVSDAELGTFERIHNSGRELLIVTLARACADVVMAVPAALGVFLFMVWLQPDSFPLWPVLGAALLTGLAAVGAGLLLAGLTLVYRRLGPASNLIMFGAIMAALLPSSGISRVMAWSVGTVIPLAGPVILVQRSVSGELGTGAEWVVAALNTVLSIHLGIWVFQWGYRKARYLGTLGRY